MTDLPAPFIERTRRLLGDDYPALPSRSNRNLRQAYGSTLRKALRQAR